MKIVDLDLKYSDGLNGGSVWETLTANWTSNSSSTTDTSTNGSSTSFSRIRRSAIGYNEKCSFPVAKVKATGKVSKVSKTLQCSKTASNVALDIDGTTARISGLARNSIASDTVYISMILEKATAY